MQPEILERLYRYVAENLDQPLHVEHLAREAGLSAFHFARSFRRATGMTPHGYVLQKRLENARHLLASTTLPITQVCRQSGFRTQAHFTGVFHRWCGSTPARYRRECAVVTSSAPRVETEPAALAAGARDLTAS